MKLKINLILQILFWLILCTLSINFYSLTFGISIVVILEALIPIMILAGAAYFNALVMIPLFFNKQGYIWYALMVIGILVLVPGVFILSDIGPSDQMKVIFSGKNKLGETGSFTRTPEQVKFTFTMMATGLILFLSSAFRLSIDFSWKENQKIQIEKEKVLAEMKYMRTQLKPHFFLNALNNLNAIIRTAPQQSEKYIAVLAEMMRYVTYDCREQFVKLEKEINYIENYIYIQQIKDDEIDIKLQIDVENKEFKIEPMLLMPFVENIFKFGMFGSNLAENPVSIKLSQIQSKLVFRCENLINPQKSQIDDHYYSGVGIDNVKQRLEASYAGRHKLHLQDNGKNFIVILELWN